MANIEHVEILKQGVEIWNLWRDEHRSVQPDLHGLNLRGIDLSGANLREVNLLEANLQGADLRWSDLIKANLFECDLSGAQLFSADLTRANFVRANLFRANLCRARLHNANLSRANLSRANLEEADMSKAILFRARLIGSNLRSANLTDANLSEVDLSGAIIDETTRLRGAQDVLAGINGIYSFSTDSAALMSSTPRGDSMLGPHPEAVLQSLTRARRYHGFSMGLAFLSLILLVTNPPELSIYTFGNIRTPIERYTFFALLFTAGMLLYAKAFLEDALEGTRYLRDRESAVQVGRFPWTLSRFAGQRWDRRATSLFARAVMAFHPVVYLFFPRVTVAWYEWILGAVIVAFCGWMFVLSQRFQKPILFDTMTELHRKSDLKILSSKLDVLIDLLKKRRL
jgi:hypothetical protein